jgi:hypothetical protein
MIDEAAAQAAKSAALDTSVATAVKAELAKLPPHLMDGVTARAALVLASTIDRAADPRFKMQSVSASIKQLTACLNELAEAALTSAPMNDAVTDINARRTRVRE